jgi:hypothetical protein
MVFRLPKNMSFASLPLEFWLIINMRKLSLTLAAISVSFAAFGQNTDRGAISAPSAETLVSAATRPATQSAASETYEDWIARFEKDFQRLGVVARGRTFYPGSAVVLGKPIDPNFGKQLALAYEMAMAEMRAEYVMSLYGRLKTTAVRELYEDQSSNADDFVPVELKTEQPLSAGRIEALLDKVLVVMDKRLDKELANQGVTPDQIKRLSVEQKKTTYKNNFNKLIVKKAVGNMQGLVPVQTKIFLDANTKAVVVGVIAVQSEKTRQFAQDMAKKRPTLVKGEPKNLDEILPKEKPGYLNELGLRFTYDEEGRPMLISYGRSSINVNPDWSPSRAFQSIQNAKSIAKTLAEANIIEFISTNVEVTETVNTGTQEEEILKRVTDFDNGAKSDQRDTRTKVAETISAIIKNSRSTASGDLRGTAEITRWDVKDDNGHLHVGTVVSWTYGQLDNANAVDAQANPSAAKKTETNIADPSRSSKPINKISDF